jgi:hypothetical protein
MELYTSLNKLKVIILYVKSWDYYTKTGDFNTCTPNFRVLFDNSYFYSFKQNAVKVNCYAIDVYENITGILNKKIAPPAGKEFWAIT